MRILVIGGTGYLGQEVLRTALRAGHEVSATYLRRPGAQEAIWHRLDLRRNADVSSTVASVRPDMIVNAAYRKDDWSTTADGAAHVAVAAETVDARLVHVSSDVVFSGAADRYDERCLPDPITPYGAAKAAAETAVRAAATNSAIVRTSLIVGDGRSPHETAVREMANGGTGVLFTDVVRCPVHVSDLAAALLELAASEHTGVHHVAGTDALSRYELGQLIARREGLDGTRLRGAPRPAATCGPLAVRLDCAATQQRLRTRLRGAREFLR